MKPEPRQPVPPFSEVFPRVLSLSVRALSAPQLQDVARSLPGRTRRLVAELLGEGGMTAVTAHLDAERVRVLAQSYPTDPRAEAGQSTETGSRGDPDPGSEPNAGGKSHAELFAAVYPEVMLATNQAMDRRQLQQVISGLSAGELASQSLFLGSAGRREVFSGLPPGHVQTILDHTPDWVLIETAKDALGSFGSYTALLEKRERVKGKLQDLERIRLKARQTPRAFYMKWGKGLFRGREVLYNEALLGVGKLRVREAGLLGVLPVTMDVHSALAGRGTNHLATEVGLHHMVSLLEKDHHRAVALGHLERINHGLATLDGRQVYKIESRLPPDPSLGYYCHRVVHYTDYVIAVDVKAEVYDFDNRLQEEMHYRELNASPHLTETDFDPKNRAYRL